MNAATNNYEVSVETAGGLERRMTIRVPNAEIEREIEARLAKVGRTARLKGFRPGKVPKKVVRQYYGGQVREEVLSDVIRATYARAIQDQKLNPAGGPRIEPLPAEGADASHFAYRAIFEVFPEVAIAPFDQLQIERPQVSIEDSDVDAMLEKLRAQRAEWRVVERPAADGDRVTVDFKGRIDNEPFEGGEGTDVKIVVGDGKVLADFDSALRGTAAGTQKTATVQFPEKYGVENLAGKTAEFDITVKAVEELELPPLDEQFAAAFGVTEGGIEKLRQEVRANMERELAERIKAETKTRTFDALLKANQVTVPRTLVEQEITSLQVDAMRQMGIDDPKKAPPRERFEDLALRRVTIGLLIQELIKNHGIKLDRDRVEQRIKELSAPYENPEEAAQFYRGNRGMMAQVEAAVLEDQVVDFLLEQAKTTDRTIGFREFMGA
jgi:trigger factor